MEDGYRKYGFSALSLKKGVAQRFRNFSRQVSPSHSQTLEAMLNFFQWNELSPNDDIGIKNDGTKKRINALIAILKNIEKHQTRPTKAMLDALFQEVTRIGETEREEVDFGAVPMISENEELSHYRGRCEDLQRRMRDMAQEFDFIMGHISYIKTTFGGGFLKLEMDRSEFETFKQRLEDVYHH